MNKPLVNFERELVQARDATKGLWWCDWQRRASLSAAIAVSMTVTACAVNPSRNLYGLGENQAAQVFDICEQVMGVRHGESHFDACAASLADSIREVNESRVLAGAHRDCEKSGLADGTPAFAQCVLRRNASNEFNDPDSRGAAKPDVLAGLSQVSYFDMAPKIRMDHERVACADLGLDPTIRAFGECVSGLSMAFFDLDNPT